MANMRWSAFYDDDEEEEYSEPTESVPKKKTVRFVRGKDLVKIHHMIVYETSKKIPRKDKTWIKASKERRLIEQFYRSLGYLMKDS